MATRQASPIGPFPGMQMGNIDLTKRPIVRNPDGSYSTVRSMSFENNGGQEVLVPTVSPDGRIMSNQEAMQLYGDTGQNLGKFDTPAHADMYAEALHKAQEQYYGGQSGGAMPDLARIKSNVAKMAAQGAPEEDIDGYIASEGVTVDDVRNFRAQPQPQAPVQAQQPEAPGYMSDMLRSAGAGLRQGVEGIGGMLGDASQMSGDAAGWAAQKLGASPETAAMVGGVAKRLNPSFGMMPTTAEVQRVTNAAAGPAYEPQTVAGEYARTVGQFAPNAALGPGGVMRRAASAVVPALVSETAGQLTKGTEAEPYARGVGALAGGIATAGKSTNAAKMPKIAAPSIDDLATQVDDFYTRSRQAGITVKADAFDRVAKNAEFAAGRLNDKLRPQTMGVLDDIAALKGKDISLEELDELRQTVGNAMEGAAKQDKRTLARIKNVIDHFTDNPKPGDFTGDAAGFTLIKEGRKLAARKAKVEVLEQIVEKAKNQATGFENGLVIHMRALANNPEKMRAFSPQEQAMIKGVVRRASGHGVLRAIGMLAPNSTFGGLTGLGIAGTGGILPGVAASAAGAAAKYGAGVLTKNKVGRLQNAVATGVAPQTGPAPLNVDALVRTLLAAKSGENSAKANSSVK